MNRAAAGAFAVVLVVAVVGPAAAGTMTAADAPPDASPSTARVAIGVVPQVTATPNGTEIRHVDPDREEPVAYGRIEGWLSVALSGRLADSTAAVDRADYQRARALLGDDVDRYLAQYADVAGETAGQEDDRIAARFADAAADQRAFADDVEGFRRTYDEYRAARRAGDEDRARRLARSLVDRSRDVGRTGDALGADYRALEAGTGEDFSTEVAVVEGVSANVTETGDRVAAESFVRTAIEVETASAVAAFDDPLAVDGRVVTANGSAVADGAVRLAAGDRTLAAGRTNEAGAFSLSTRPTLLAVGPQTLSVRYVPRPTSVYLGANASAATEIEQVEPTIAVDATPTTVRFGDDLRLTGRVRVGETPVPDVPVAASIDGVEVARVTTGGDGAFAASVRFPADVPPGERTVGARLPTAGLAVGPARTSATIAVEERPTVLSVSVTRTGSETATVEGALATDGGRAVGGQSVDLSIDGEPVARVRTGDDGRLSHTIQDERLSRDTEVGVTARFDGRGTNLAASNASAVVPAATFGEASGSASEGVPGPDWVGAVAAVGLFLLVAGGYALVRRRRETGPGGPDPSSTGARAGSPRPGESVSARLLTRARESLSEDRPELAVRIAYGAARERLGRDVEGQATNTHWEFYRACADRLDDERDRALQTLTEAFEVAAFARDGTDREVASGAIEAAGRLVE